MHLSLLSTFSPPSPLIIQTQSKHQKIPRSDNLHFWGKVRLRKISANHTSLNKLGVAKCCTAFPTFPCQCSSASFEAALLSQSWAVPEQRLSLAPGCIGGCQGQEKHAGGEECYTGRCLLMTHIIALWLRKLISTDDLDRACLLAFQNKWLKPRNIIVCWGGFFFASSPPQHRGSRSYLDPQNFWVSDAKGEILCSCL